MASTAATAMPGGFAPFHLSPAMNDALIAAHGSAAQLRFAMPCGCSLAKTGGADPACDQCFPYGVLWDAPIDVIVLGPNRKPIRRYESGGEFETGDAFVTLQSGIMPPVFSRLTSPLSAITVDDVLTKGRQDVIRFTNVIAVQKGRYVTQVPGTVVRAFAPYTNVVHDLVLTGSGADVAITGRQVTWLNPSIPDGTRYVLRLTALAEYIIVEPQDRNEGGQALQGKFHARRMDFLKHPSSPQGLTY